jgi:hypothetical protein
VLTKKGSDEEGARARRALANIAHDADDLRLLLDALGLWPEQRAERLMTDLEPHGPFAKPGGAQ